MTKDDNMYKVEIGEKSVTFIPEISARRRYKTEEDFWRDLFDKMVKEVNEYRKEYPSINEYRIKLNDPDKNTVRKILSSHVKEKAKTTFYSLLGAVGGDLIALGQCVRILLQNPSVLPTPLEILLPINAGMLIGVVADYLHARKAEKIIEAYELISIE